MHVSEDSMWRILCKTFWELNSGHRCWCYCDRRRWQKASAWQFPEREKLSSGITSATNPASVSIIWFSVYFLETKKVGWLPMKATITCHLPSSEAGRKEQRSMMMRFTVNFRERTVGACCVFALFPRFLCFLLFSLLVKEIVMRPAE